MKARLPDHVAEFTGHGTGAPGKAASFAAGRARRASYVIHAHSEVV